MHIEDSGTESGEDLKLLAAGLHDQLEMQRDQSQGNKPKEHVVQNNILAEVTSALTRLQATLLEGNGIDLDNTKRTALLSLVLRLQTGLLTPDLAPNLSSPEADAASNIPRRPAGHGRFAKKRNRQNRHTVGVSQEELADARRYIEELVMIENMSNNGTPETMTPPSICPYILQKQSSAGAVLSTPAGAPLFRPNQFIPGNNVPPTKTIPSVVPTPRDNPSVVQLREKKPQYRFSRQSLSLDQAQDDTSESRRPYSEYIPSKYVPVNDDFSGPKIGQSTVQRAAQFYNKKTDSYPYASSEDEEIPNRNKQSNQGYDSKHIPKPTTNNSVFNNMIKTVRSRTPPGKIFHDASSDSGLKDKPSNKFSNKKMKMKRANTIDIPKAFKYQNGDNDDDDSDVEMGFTRDEGSIGLKGTIQAGSKVNVKKNAVPKFTPKTENDHKFLAFIQKQNANNAPSWINPNKNLKSHSNRHNWSNAFGNIKNTFESSSNESNKHIPPNKSYQSPARNFWKQAETPPLNINRDTKPVRNNNFNNMEMPPKHKIENNYSVPESPKILIPKPIPVNEFSHAPRSAFQPIMRKVESIVATFKPIQPDPKPEVKPAPIKLSNGVLHEDPLKMAQRKHLAQDSPIKQFSNSYLNQENQIKSPPSVGVPWANKINNDHRVLALAASKFDMKSPPMQELIPPRVTNLGKYSPGAFPTKYTGARMQQKRGSLPNDSTYSYFDDGYAPNLIQTQRNTAQNESIYNEPAAKNHYNYGPSSLQNLSAYSREPQQRLYADPRYSSDYQQNYFPNAHAPVASMQQKIPETYAASQYAQNSYNPKQPNHANQNYRSQEASDFPAYPYTCTDYTLPTCVSTYIPKVTVTSDRSDSITNPKAEPLVLTSSRPIISPSNRPDYTYNNKNPDPNQKSGPELLKIFDYSSSENSPKSTSVSPNTLNDALDDELDQSSMKEYTVKSQVMKGPVSQTAVTVSNKTSRIGDEFDGKGSEAAKNLHSVLKSIKSKSPDSRPKPASGKEMPPSQNHNYYPVDPSQSGKDHNGNSNPNYPRHFEYGQTNQNQDHRMHQHDYNFVNQKPNVSSQPIDYNYVSQKPNVSSQPNDYYHNQNSRNYNQSGQNYQNEIDRRYLNQIDRDHYRVIDRDNEIAQNHRSDMYQNVSDRRYHNGTDHAYQNHVDHQSDRFYHNEMFSAGDVVDHIARNQTNRIYPNENNYQNQNMFENPNIVPKPPVQPRPPQIVETPATPQAVQRSEAPSHIVYNHVPPYINSQNSTGAYYNKHSQSEINSNHTRNHVKSSSYEQQSAYNMVNSSPRRSPVALSKSDSWNQICQAANQSQSQTNDGRPLQKTKSGHTLQIPRPFEAGMKKIDVTDKQRTVAAYFSGEKSPQSLSRSSSQKNIAETTIISTSANAQNKQQNTTTTTTNDKRKSQITRIKSSEKASISKQVPSSGIVRSQTMPYMANLNLLDESNVDDAFEDLFSSMA